MVQQVMRLVQPMGARLAQHPLVQRFLLLAGVVSAYAGGVGFMLMLARGLAAL